MLLTVIPLSVPVLCRTPDLPLLGYSEGESDDITFRRSEKRWSTQLCEQ